MTPLTILRPSGAMAATCAAVCAALTLLAPAGLLAQPSGEPAAPAHVAAVDGDVALHREFVDEPANPGAPFVPGDRLNTTRGRAEILFPDGSALDLDEFTSIELQAPSLVRLTSGRVLLTVSRQSLAAGVRYRVDTPAASADLTEPGEYRLTVLGTSATPQAELAVLRGSSLLTSGGGSALLGAGERTTVWADTAPAPPQIFNSAQFDPFTQWAALQRDARSGGGRSAQYLPPDLRVYGGTLDQSGSWQYESSYGYVWYPTVAAAWQPYYSGYWSSVPLYGWTWVGGERWAWPTHHYGRWGHARSRWFWIPGPKWGPGWVSWGGAPGYVGWSPLGYDNRPVFALNVGVGPVWGSWVVMPRQHFGVYGRYANRYGVPAGSLPPRTPFVVQAGPPAGPPRTPVRRIAGDDRGVAVPRYPSQGGGAIASGNRNGPAQGVPGRGPASASVAPRVPSQAGVATVPPGSRGTAMTRGGSSLSSGSAIRDGRSVRVPAPPSREPNASTAPAPGAAVRAPSARTYPFGDFRGPRPEMTAPGAVIRSPRPAPSGVPSGGSTGAAPGAPGRSSASPEAGSAISRRPSGGSTGFGRSTPPPAATTSEANRPSTMRGGGASAVPRGSVPRGGGAISNGGSGQISSGGGASSGSSIAGGGRAVPRGGGGQPSVGMGVQTGPGSAGGGRSPGSRQPR